MSVQGTYSKSFQPLADVLEKQVRHYGGGAAVAVYQNGRPIVDIWAGSADHDQAPWREDSIAIGFSTTKGILATALHMLVTRGLIDYDRPVAHYWPEFAANGKENITVRQLASHQAGLYKLPKGLHFSAALDWEPMADALAQQKPDHPPGKYAGYHAVTIAWLTGELIRRVTGKNFDEFVAEEIAGPLNLDGLYVGVPESELGRIAARKRKPEVEQKRRRLASFHPPKPVRRAVARATTRQRHAFVADGIGKMMFDEVYHQVPIPSVNGHFTARSLAGMYAALSLGGSLDGVKLVDEHVLDQATKVQIGGLDHVLKVPMGWRIGYHSFGRGHAFGHFGMGGSGGWADRKRKLSVAMIHNGNPMGIRAQFRMLGINRAIEKSLNT